jgi:hypothetical protein
MRSRFLAFVGGFHFNVFFRVFILRSPLAPPPSITSHAVWQHPVGGLAVLSFQRRPSSGTSLASKPRRVLDSHLRSTLSTCPRADRTITKSFYVFRAPTRRSRVVASHLSQNAFFEKKVGEEVRRMRRVGTTKDGSILAFGEPTWGEISVDLSADVNEIFVNEIFYETPDVPSDLLRMTEKF